MILPGSYTGQIKCPDAALADVPKKSATGARKRKIWRYSTEAEYTKRGKAGDSDRNKEFDLKNHAYVMGILNVTPDSFSDGGKWNDKGRAMRHTQEMIEQGATIIDIGGESTRPGYTLISDEEEISRVVPMIEMVKKNFDVPVSIDTYKSRVAEAALDAGADLVNDIWGLKYDPDLAGVIARKNAPCQLILQP